MLTTVFNKIESFRSRKKDSECAKKIDILLWSHRSRPDIRRRIAQFSTGLHNITGGLKMLARFYFMTGSLFEFSPPIELLTESTSPSKKSVALRIGQGAEKHACAPWVREVLCRLIEGQGEGICPKLHPTDRSRSPSQPTC
jgi:hypothetical protein